MGTTALEVQECEENMSMEYSYEQLNERDKEFIDGVDYAVSVIKDKTELIIKSLCGCAPTAVADIISDVAKQTLEATIETIDEYRKDMIITLLDNECE